MVRQWGRLEGGEGISLAVADEACDVARGLAVVLLREQPGVAGIGYWIVPGARRSGLASHAVALLSDWALPGSGSPGWKRGSSRATSRRYACSRRRASSARASSASFLAVGDRRADAVVLSRIAGE